jgi:hypothetical protein
VDSIASQAAQRRSEALEEETSRPPEGSGRRLQVVKPNACGPAAQAVAPLGLVAVSGSRGLARRRKAPCLRGPGRHRVAQEGGRLLSHGPGRGARRLRCGPVRRAWPLLAKRISLAPGLRGSPCGRRDAWGLSGGAHRPPGGFGSCGSARLQGGRMPALRPRWSGRPTNAAQQTPFFPSPLGSARRERPIPEGFAQEVRLVGTALGCRASVARASRSGPIQRAAGAPRAQTSVLLFGFAGRVGCSAPGAAGC